MGNEKKIEVIIKASKIPKWLSYRDMIREMERNNLI